MGERCARLLAIMALHAFMLFAPVVSFAQNVNPFTFDFTPRADAIGLYDSYPHIYCQIEGKINHNCNVGTEKTEVKTLTGTWVNQDAWYTTGNMANEFEKPALRTRFLQDVVVINSVEYYHIVVGQPETGFAQEIYIRKNTMAGGSPGGIFSDSGGSVCFPSPTDPLLDGPYRCGMSNHAADPLRNYDTFTAGGDPRFMANIFTGNGTGDPSRMVMKQVVADQVGGFTQEFFKQYESQKPVISQDVTDGIATSHFVMDMSNSNYNQNAIAGIMTNTFTLTDPYLPPGFADFTFTPGAGTNITAGRYTFARNYVSYTNQRGWKSNLSNSNYVYYDGTIDNVMKVDWKAFRDPAQNPHHYGEP